MRFGELPCVGRLCTGSKKMEDPRALVRAAGLSGSSGVMALAVADGLAAHHQGDDDAAEDRDCEVDQVVDDLFAHPVRPFFVGNRGAGGACVPVRVRLATDGIHEVGRILEY